MQNAVQDNYYYEFYSGDTFQLRYLLSKSCSLLDGHYMRAFVGRRENNWFSSKSFVFTHLAFTFLYNENKVKYFVSKSLCFMRVYALFRLLQPTFNLKKSIRTVLSVYAFFQQSISHTASYG